MSVQNEQGKQKQKNKHYDDEKEERGFVLFMVAAIPASGLIIIKIGKTSRAFFVQKPVPRSGIILFSSAIWTFIGIIFYHSVAV